MQYNNIIFDLGGVVLDISYERTRNAFIHIGFADFETVYSQLKQDNIFDLFETGKITENDFRDAIRNCSHKDLLDSEIDSAWNAMIIGLPEQRVEFLKKLKQNQRLFLLSNTNCIHEKKFTSKIISGYGKNVLEELFERIYYSHHVGLRKPQTEIFKMILDENNLKATETFFIDDSPQHIEGGIKIGLKSILLDRDKTTLEELLAKTLNTKH